MQQSEGCIATYDMLQWCMHLATPKKKQISGFKFKTPDEKTYTGVFPQHVDVQHFF